MGRTQQSCCGRVGYQKRLSLVLTAENRWLIIIIIIISVTITGTIVVTTVTNTRIIIMIILSLFLIKLHAKKAYSSSLLGRLSPSQRARITSWTEC
jgi:hypothetical protein